MEAKICEISDPSFESLVTELCQCVKLDENDFVKHPLPFLLMSIGNMQKGKELIVRNLREPKILTTKIKELPPGSIVHCVCVDLVNRNGIPIEDCAGETVLSLIKICYKVFCPAMSRKKQSTRLERGHQSTTEVINRRRQNGDL